MPSVILRNFLRLTAADKCLSKRFSPFGIPRLFHLFFYLLKPIRLTLPTKRARTCSGTRPRPPRFPKRARSQLELSFFPTAATFLMHQLFCAPDFFTDDRQPAERVTPLPDLSRQLSHARSPPISSLVSPQTRAPHTGAQLRFSFVRLIFHPTGLEAIPFLFFF